MSTDWIMKCRCLDEDYCPVHRFHEPTADELRRVYRAQKVRVVPEAHGPVYIRHRTTRKHVTVELVQVTYGITPLTVKERLGYYTSENVDSEVCFYGPFTSLAEARASDKARVEDV
jgi:hypothetical protein